MGHSWVREGPRRGPHEIELGTWASRKPIASMPPRILSGERREAHSPERIPLMRLAEHLSLQPVNYHGILSRSKSGPVAPLRRSCMAHALVPHVASRSPRDHRSQIDEV